jgi:hypothetical protein
MRIMLRHLPLRVELTTELMYRPSWHEELERALQKLEQAQADMGLQIAVYAQVDVDESRHLVYVYPRHYHVPGLYVDCIPTAIKGAFLKRYLTHSTAAQLDEFLRREFGI